MSPIEKHKSVLQACLFTTGLQNQESFRPFSSLWVVQHAHLASASVHVCHSIASLRPGVCLFIQTSPAVSVRTALSVSLFNQGITGSWLPLLREATPQCSLQSPGHQVLSPQTGADEQRSGKHSAPASVASRIAVVLTIFSAGTNHINNLMSF